MLSFTFGLQISVQFLSNPWFIRQIPCLLRMSISFLFRCSSNVRGKVPIDCLWSVSNDSVCNTRMKGGKAGSFWWQNKLCGCAWKIILACDYTILEIIHSVWGDIFLKYNAQETYIYINKRRQWIWTMGRHVISHSVCNSLRQN